LTIPGESGAVRGALAALLLLAAGAGVASADPVDPGIPQRLRSAAPAGGAVGERIDLGGRNLSPLALPLAPAVAWQARVASPLAGPPLSAENGVLVVAHGNGRVSELDDKGRTRWSVRTGLELAGGPLVIGGGLRVVVGRSGEIVAVSSAGRVVAREQLPSGAFEAAVLATPTRDGGALLATGARLTRLTPKAAIAWSTSTTEPLRAVFEWRGQALAVSRSGAVIARAVAGEPEEIANLGGAAGRAALDGDSLFALVSGHKLVELDLVRRTQRTRFSDPALELHDFALPAAASPRVISTRGVLVSLDASDRELARTALAQESGSGQVAGIVVDGAGTTLVAFGSAPLVLVTPQGDARALAGSACPDPYRPTPLRAGLVAAACRSGLIRGLSDKAR
jgi:hypothetical protein